MTLRRATYLCGVVLLMPSLLNAAIRRVPEDHPNVKAAYNAAQSGDTIEIRTNLNLEVPPALFDNPSKLVLFRVASGTAVIAPNIPPPNDSFAGRTSLSGMSITITTDNYTAAAAPEAGDPVPRGAFGTDTFGRSVWFEWTAPVSGHAIVNSVGSDFDTLLDVFKGTAYPPARLGADLVWNNTLNEVVFNARAGVAYQILVGGHYRAYGQITLNVTMIGPPFNDHFSAAHTLTGHVAQLKGTTISATFEDPLEPSHANASASNSVWFTWTAPSGDGLLPRPVTFSTAGSDFNTVLAVYEGPTLSQLLARAGNDDRAPPALESQVTFTPTPGGTYYIALDGSTNSSSATRQSGNYLLWLDYSVVDLAVQQVSPGSLVNDRRSFQADVTVRNWGLAPTGPLRIRLAARHGRDYAGIHRAPAASETNLDFFAIPAPNGLMPGESRSLIVSGVCPAPQQGTFIGPWGVFAVLEEFFPTNLMNLSQGEWVTIDRTFLLYGFGGFSQVVSYGVGRPVPSTLAPNETNQVLGFDVRVSNYVTDGSSNLFTMIAQLDTGGERVVGNASWYGPAWVMLSTNGVLRIGDIPRSTNFTVIGSNYLGGVWKTRTDNVPIYRRPRLTLLPTPTPDSFQYVVQSDWREVFPNLIAPFALEYTNNLGASAWQTNSVGTFSRFPATNALFGTNLNHRFYRLNLRPQP